MEFYYAYPLTSFLHFATSLETRNEYHEGHGGSREDARLCEGRWGEGGGGEGENEHLLRAVVVLVLLMVEVVLLLLLFLLLFLLSPPLPPVPSPLSLPLASHDWPLVPSWSSSSWWLSLRCRTVFNLSITWRRKRKERWEWETLSFYVVLLLGFVR